MLSILYYMIQIMNINYVLVSFCYCGSFSMRVRVKEIGKETMKLLSSDLVESKPLYSKATM